MNIQLIRLGAFLNLVENRLNVFLPVGLHTILHCSFGLPDFTAVLLEMVKPGSKNPFAT